MELEDNNKYIELLGTEGKLKINILTADEKEEFKKLFNQCMINIRKILEMIYSILQMNIINSYIEGG